MNTVTISLIQILQNLTVLFALVFVFTLIKPHLNTFKPLFQQIIFGFIFGIIAIISMQVHIIETPGISGRFLIACVAGMFCGPIPALITAAFAGYWRYSIGGFGLIPGIGSIITSCFTGIIIFAIWKNKVYHFRIYYFIIIGMIIAFQGIFWIFFLPAHTIFTMLREMTLPLFFSNVIDMTVLGILFKYTMRQKEIENRFQNIFNGANDAIFIQNEIDGSILDVNDTMLAMYGYDNKKEVLNLPIDKFGVIEEGYSMTEALKKISITSELYSHLFIWHAKRKNGTTFWVEVSLKRNIIGSEYRIIASVRDISDRKKIEMKLQNERDRSQKYLDTVESIIVSLNHEGKISLINRKGREVLGYTESELLGQNWFKKCLPQPEGMEKVYPYFLKMLHGEMNSTEYQENSIITKSGIIRTIAWHNSLIISEDGTILETLSSGEDITERKKNEKELEDYRHNLEILVEERTNALEKINKDLILAKEAADKSNKSKSQFLANMSHEMRTPFNSILGFSKLLVKDDTLSDTQKSKLEIIIKSSDHLLKLIDNILEMSKIEAGHIKLDINNINLQSTLFSIINMMKSKAAEKGLELHLELSDKVPQRLKMDEMKFSQILINLINNSMKYTDQGYIKVSIQHKKTETLCMIHLICTIEDSGIGIASENLEKIFSPFERVGDKQNNISGAGLGLAITNQYVQLMNGTIEVESTKGKGSIFTVTIPVEVANENCIISESENEIKSVTGYANTGKKYTILIADDQIENCLLLKNILEDAGFTVISVHNGCEAINETIKSSPDLIFMDWRMPQMDGIEAIKQIKQIENSKNIPIIALTANAFNEYKEEILKAGASDFIKKPFREIELFDTIQKYLPIIYTYKEGVRHNKNEGENFDISAIAKEVPQSTKTEILTAARLGVSNDIKNILKNNPELDSTLTNKIEKLLYLYNFEEIIALFETE
ncbi:MAG: hypothetical protein A2015_16040 [Spirochaetes bacterium GWF1_31_7]|nr:MAG: hypothetical protein A2Y30_13415 [Spirochaetes bacterium GWE1_32_154]OHD49965.1 MAG: hypothetical protein A2Y29_11460 [Spirochaetes bacterium GWE2_31_10]OHD52282.1 MAG: hypothetical protein A2015_16040 [Spirochaetes bacterium GWF1_31_7]HBD96443.1 hypothetical protein [Spirochaetia bacterium]HBI38424.1 hypothetical protein [Spirochaetia bacterium]